MLIQMKFSLSLIAKEHVFLGAGSLAHFFCRSMYGPMAGYIITLIGTFVRDV